MELTYRRGGARRLDRTGTGRPYKRFAVRPQTTLIGAEIQGLDLVVPSTANREPRRA